jgi:hypothetical protein
MTDPKEPSSDATEPIPTPIADGAADTTEPPHPVAAEQLDGELVDEVDQADQDESDFEDEDELDEEAEADTAPVVGAGTIAGPVVGAAAVVGRPTRGPTSSSAPVAEPAIRINDRASKIFVIATVAVFALIFLNGMLLGTGGTFRPYITPSPAPSVSASPSVAASESPAPSGSIGPSAAASGSVAPSVSAPAASGSPAAS